MSYASALGKKKAHCQALRHTEHFLPKLSCPLCQNWDQNLASLYQQDNFCPTVWHKWFTHEHHSVLRYGPSHQFSEKESGTSTSLLVKTLKHWISKTTFALATDKVVPQQGSCIQPHFFCPSLFFPSLFNATCATQLRSNRNWEKSCKAPSWAWTKAFA